MNRALNNTALIKSVEEIDENAAIEMISNPNLDHAELSEVLNAHFYKSIKDKDTNEPLQLNNKVAMAGVLNLLLKINNETV